MTILDRTALLDIAAKAAKATPGPWENRDGFVRSPGHGETIQHGIMTITTSTAWVAECRDGEAFYNWQANAAYIAAANPAVLTSLIERLIAAEEALAPFDLACDLIADHYLDEDFIELPGTTPPASIKVGAFRAARRARAKIDGGKG